MTRILNLGILAHVDAGKTTLTERLLYNTGVIDRIGSVDAGSTQTDFLPLERQRGITIKSAVASFTLGAITINLIDTPGHPDFIAEVERVLNVLDGAVLVISAVEGVQPQTRVLMRTLQRLRTPTLIFVNKIDRAGAQEEGVLRSIAERLTPAIIAMGSTDGLGTREARYLPFAPDDAEFTSRLAELLADHDDVFLAEYIEREASIPQGRMRCELATQTGRASVHPVFFGAAITGAGVEALMAGIEELLPATEGDAEGRVSGTVFKVDRGPVGEKIAFVRMNSGTVCTRDRLRYGGGHEGKVTAIGLFDRGSAVPSGSVAAGQIAKLWGLSEVKIGDTIEGLGTPQQPLPSVAHNGRTSEAGNGHYFAPPTLETAIVPCRPSEKGALHLALSRLAEQDPLINLRQDDLRQEMYVSLYGEVQKEVIEATLALDFNLEVAFRETSVICVERPGGSGEAVELLGKGGNPFLATLGFRVEPAPLGSGVELRIEAELVSIPLYIYGSVEQFHAAMTENVREALQQGLYGWQVVDCTVILTRCGYVSPSSGAKDFRLLTPLVLMAALQQAGTTVCEPVHHFLLELPEDTFGAAAPLLAKLGAVMQSSTMRGPSYVLEGEILAAKIHELQQRLPAATRGEGVLEYSFDHHQPVDGIIPTRPRSDLNPLNRKEYLLHVVRRV